MSASRPIRVARVRAPPTDRVVRVPVPRTPTAVSPAAGAPEVRENHAGTQRATRLAVVYAAAMLLLYGLLAAYARGGPGGTTPGVTANLEVYALVAVVLAAVGAGLSLNAAPRRVELLRDATVVVGRFGRRMTYGASEHLDVRTVRRFGAGLLSKEAVVQVELGPKGKGRRRSFLIAEHLLDGPVPSPP